LLNTWYARRQVQTFLLTRRFLAVICHPLDPDNPSLRVPTLRSPLVPAGRTSAETLSELPLPTLDGGAEWSEGRPTERS
jgi:hypothetical protein